MQFLPTITASCGVNLHPKIMFFFCLLAWENIWDQRVPDHFNKVEIRRLKYKLLSPTQEIAKIENDTGYRFQYHKAMKLQITNGLLKKILLFIKRSSIVLCNIHSCHHLSYNFSSKLTGKQKIASIFSLLHTKQSPYFSIIQPKNVINIRAHTSLK